MTTLSETAAIATSRALTFAKPRQLQWLTAHLPAALVFLVSFVVYLRTLAPTVFALDSAEFAAAAYGLGVPHATGYPLYILLGKLFTYLPVGDVGYRVNLMSAVFAAGAVMVMYQLAFLVTRRMLLSMAVAGFLAFSYYFWASAVVAEVYTLHAFLTVTTIYLLLRWDRGGNRSLLYLAGFVWGLSFGNHMTTVLLTPAFAYLVVMGLRRNHIQWSHVAILAGCFLPTLGLYSYFPIRAQASDVWPFIAGQYDANGQFVRDDLASLQGMWTMLTAQKFHTFLFAFKGFALLEELGRSVWWLVANFLGVGFALGVVGIVRNWKTDRRRFVFLGLILLANLIFFATYGAVDKDQMVLAVYIVWALWVAEGLAYLVGALQSRGRSQASGETGAHLPRRRGRIRLEALALFLPVLALGINFSYADVSSDTQERDRYTQVLTAIEPDALVVGYWAEVTSMLYLQQVEGLRPDVQLIDRFLIDDENETKLIEARLSTQPVYVFGRLPDLSTPYRAVPLLDEELGLYQLLPSTSGPRSTTVDEGGPP